MSEFRCNLCNSEKLELYKSKLRDESSDYKVYRCFNCSHIQLLPRPSTDDDKEFYNENLQDKRRGKEIDYDKLLSNNQFDTDRHVKLLQDLNIQKNHKILDIGSGYGFFIKGLLDSGYKNVLGVEISKERRKIPVEHSLPVIDLDINEPNTDIGKFDAITLFHVLEHTADPVGFLRTVCSYLSESGILVCEVPNTDELLLKTCDKYNDFYWIRAHLNYFCKETLKNCLENSGFSNYKIIFTQRYGLINLCNWLNTGQPQIESPIFEISDTPGWKKYINLISSKTMSVTRC